MKKSLAVLIILLIGVWLIRTLQEKYSAIDQNLSQNIDFKNFSDSAGTPPPKSDTPQNRLENNPKPSSLNTESKRESSPSQAESILPSKDAPHYNSNDLVSCQTQRRYCEPYKALDNQEDPLQSTFCITYASYCDSLDSIQKVWTPEEVFTDNPEPLTNEDPDNISNSENPNFSPEPLPQGGQNYDPNMPIPVPGDPPPPANPIAPELSEPPYDE